MPLTSCVLLDDTSSLSLNLPFCKAGIMMPNFVGKLNNHTGKFPSTLMGETFYWVINSTGEVSEPTSDDCEVCTFNFETFRNCWACGLENNFNKEECICPIFFGWSKKNLGVCERNGQGTDTVVLEWDGTCLLWDTRGIKASLVAQLVKNLLATQKTLVQFLGLKDPLEEGMATHTSILAWRIPMDRGTWGGYSPCGGKESDTTEQLSLLGEKSPCYRYQINQDYT